MTLMKNNQSNPNAIILCAGEGTRLQPLTYNLPKSMIPLAGRPLLEWNLRYLNHFGIKDVAINLYSHGNVIEAYFGDGIDGIHIQYSREPQLLGTAGALAPFHSFFHDPFIVIYGDILTNMDLANLVSFHKKMNALATVSLYRVSNPHECGIVQIGSRGKVHSFIEKPLGSSSGNLANAGVYVLSKRIFSWILSREPPLDFGKDVFPLLLAENQPIYGKEVSAMEFLFDLGSIERYNTVKRLVEEGRISLF